MKLYSAELYAVNHGIPYFKKVLYEKDGVVEYYDPMCEDKCNTRCVANAMIHIRSLVVYKSFFGKVVDVTTGKKFPLMKDNQVYINTLTDRRVKSHKYKFTQANQRLYVELQCKMPTYEVKDFYESLTKERIQHDNIVLQEEIEKENRYWNEIPKKISNRQYVKMIEQMRK